MNDHHHHHGDEHHRAHESAGPGEMSVPEKLKKMVQHWLRHNADHAATYRQWAERARRAGMADVAEILDSVAEDSQAVNGDLERAERVLAQRF